MGISESLNANYMPLLAVLVPSPAHAEMAVLGSANLKSTNLQKFGKMTSPPNNYFQPYSVCTCTCIRAVYMRRIYMYTAQIQATVDGLIPLRAFGRLFHPITSLNVTDCQMLSYFANGTKSLRQPQVLQYIHVYMYMYQDRRQCKWVYVHMYIW